MAVLRRIFPRGKIEFLPETVDDLFGSPYVTGGTAACGYPVFADRFQAELGLKGGHAVKTARCDTEFSGKKLHSLLRDIPEDLLCILQKGDNIAALFSKFIEYIFELFIHKINL